MEVNFLAVSASAFGGWDRQRPKALTFARFKVVLAQAVCIYFATLALRSCAYLTDVDSHKRM